MERELPNSTDQAATRAPVPRRPSAPRGSWRAVAGVDRASLARRAGVTGAIGYAIPLLAGLLSGHTREGVTASAGALIVGYADLGGRYRLQAQTLIGTAGCGSIAVLLGSLTQPSVVATSAVVAAWGFLAGVTVSLGPRINLVGTLSTWSLLLAGDLRLHGHSVLHETVLITAGAAMQVAVTLTLSALHPRRIPPREHPTVRRVREYLRTSPAAIAHAVRRAHLQPLAVRHGVRLAVALVLAVIAYRCLSLGFGYWVPLTVLFLVKPDYETTIARALGRALGTLAGIGVAWLVITVSGGSKPACLVLMLGLVGVAFLLYRANYALSTIALTTVIGLVVELSGGSPTGALLDRATDVGVGTLIALGIFFIYPGKQRQAQTRGAPPHRPGQRIEIIHPTEHSRPARMRPSGLPLLAPRSSGRHAERARTVYSFRDQGSHDAAFVSYPRERECESAVDVTSTLASCP